MWLLRKIRAIANFPRDVSNASKAVDAWVERDWPSVEHFLGPAIKSETATSIERVILAIALTRQGKFDEAQFHFEQIRPEGFTRIVEPFYISNYAFLLARIGRLDDAKAVVRGSSRNRWAETQHEWADELLSTEADPDPPTLDGLSIKKRSLQ
jgi:hypothetical protein